MRWVFLCPHDGLLAFYKLFTRSQCCMWCSCSCRCSIVAVRESPEVSGKAINLLCCKPQWAGEGKYQGNLKGLWGWRITMGRVSSRLQVVLRKELAGSSASLTWRSSSPSIFNVSLASASCSQDRMEPWAALSLPGVRPEAWRSNE